MKIRVGTVSDKGRVMVLDTRLIGEGMGSGG